MTDLPPEGAPVFWSSGQPGHIVAGGRLSVPAALVHIEDAIEDAGHEVGVEWNDGDQSFVGITIHGQEFVLRLTRK